MMYFFKKFVPINQIERFICIGIPSSKQYVEVDNNKENYTLLEELIANGVEDILACSIPLYKLLLDNELLTQTKPLHSNEELNRNNLYMEYLIGRSLTKKEKLSKILILGAGAGGSSLCYQLCQLGFENITIVDIDNVEKSDISKSIVYDTSSIGKSKIDALKLKMYNQFNIKLKIFNVDISSYSKLKYILSKSSPDLVIKAADPSGDFRKNLNLLCYKNRIPYILMSYSFNQLNIGPFYIPGYTPCDIHFSELISSIYGKHYGYSRKESKRLFTRNLVHPSNTMNIGILSSLLAMEIIFFITKKFKLCKSIGRLVLFNPISLNFKSIPIKAESYCVVCSNI